MSVVSPTTAFKPPRAAADSAPPLYHLNDGNRIPLLGWGMGSVHKIRKRVDGEINEALVQLVARAIQTGYIHIDTAEWFQNEEELGRAIVESGVPREKLYITTKVAGAKNQVLSDAIDQSLARLGLEYVDMYLLNSPWHADSSRHVQKLWKEMEDIKFSGKARSVGVTNFDQHQLEALLKKSRLPPALNQVEFHPYRQHASGGGGGIIHGGGGGGNGGGGLLEFHRKWRIATGAYGTLMPLTQARGGPVDACWSVLGFKYGVSETEVGLRWAMDQGVVTVTTSGNPQRMQSVRSKVFKFHLAPHDVEEVRELGRGKTFVGSYGGLFFQEPMTTATTTTTTKTIVGGKTTMTITAGQSEKEKEKKKRW